MRDRVAIGIDLGGTNLKIALVDQEGRLLDKQSTPVAPDQPPDAVVQEMVQAGNALLAAQSLSRSALVGVGIGAPGPLSPSKGRIIRSVNLSSWVDVPIREKLSDAFGCSATLDNDGNAAAFGEFWAGDGSKTEDLVMLTLGTGIGGGVVLAGKVFHGHFENGAELGHTIVLPGGLPCPCGQRGCLEQYASASAVARRVLAAIESGEPSTLGEHLLRSGIITAQEVAQAAQHDDSVCRRIWDEACLYLATACVNIQHTFNPGRIVLGGGLSEAGAFLLDNVEEQFVDLRWGMHDDFPKITLAKLGYDAGVIGAAGLAWAAIADI